MEFICPRCRNQSGSFRISHSIELPARLSPGNDELSLQVVACGACGFRGAAVYEESRRGGLDSESWRHYCVAAPADKLNTLARLIERCPARGKWWCFCPAHLMIGRQTFFLFGRWKPPVPLDASETFPMRVPKMVGVGGGPGRAPNDGVEKEEAAMTVPMLYWMLECRNCSTRRVVCDTFLERVSTGGGIPAPGAGWGGRELPQRYGCLKGCTGRPRVIGSIYSPNDEAMWVDGSYRAVRMDLKQRAEWASLLGEAGLELNV